MSELHPIHFLASQYNRIPEAIAPRFKRQGFFLKAHQPGNNPGNVFLIFSPIWDGKQYQSVEGVWARFFAEKFTDTKMIVLGNSLDHDPNFIDLFHLPEDWPTSIENIPTAARFKKKEEIRVLTAGVDMLEYLRRFLKGHGHDSLLSACKEMQLYVAPSADALGDDSKMESILEMLHDGYIFSSWDSLNLRWKKYGQQFAFLPFASIFEKIRDAMTQLAAIFEKKALDQAYVRALIGQAGPNLELLNEQLEKLEQYV